jgi:hypothetical protein
MVVTTNAIVDPKIGARPPVTHYSAEATGRAPTDFYAITNAVYEGVAREADQCGQLTNILLAASHRSARVKCRPLVTVLRLLSLRLRKARYRRPLDFQLRDKIGVVIRQASASSGNRSVRLELY